MAVRSERAKLLEHTRGNARDIGLDNDFFSRTPKAQATKTKIDRWDSIKPKSCTAKERINNEETHQEKVRVSHTCGKGLRSNDTRNPIARKQPHLRMGEGPQQAVLKTIHTVGV